MAEDKKKKTTKALKVNKAKGIDPSQAQQPGFAIEKRIAEQYERIVNPVLVPNTPAGTSEEPEVIRLFDDE